MNNEIVLFTDGDINLEVQVSPDQETVWLTQKQMEELFDVKHATISEHITNILESGELSETSVGFSDKSSGGRKPKIYNLDMILYADGCKRIAASLFLEFLEKNNALFRDGQKIISDGALVAITLMIAESRPEEKDIMVALVMNFLTI